MFTLVTQKYEKKVELIYKHLSTCYLQAYFFIR